MNRSNLRLGFSGFLPQAFFALLLLLPQLTGVATRWQSLAAGVDLGAFTASHPVIMATPGS